MAQHEPVNPDAHKHWYEHVFGLAIQFPPLRHGLEEHGLLSLMKKKIEKLTLNYFVSEIRK